MRERIWNKEAGKKGLLGCLQALGFAIYLYLCLRWWGYIFLSVLYGLSVVDKENLKIVWSYRRRVPAGVSNGDLLTPGQDLAYNLGWFVLVFCVPWLLFYSHKVYLNKFRQKVEPEQTLKSPSKRKVLRKQKRRQRHK